MENNNFQEKAGPSRKSDVIIITPDELVKLGMIPEMMNTSTENGKPKNETSDGDIKGKQKRKSRKDSKYIIKNKKGNMFDPQVIEKKIHSTIVSNKKFMKLENKNKFEQDTSAMKHDKPYPIILIPKTTNQKQNVIDVSPSNIDGNSYSPTDVINSSKNKILNGKNEEKNISSSKESKSFENFKEFKQTLERGLSKKLQELGNCIPQELEIKRKPSVIENTENLYISNVINEFQPNNSIEVESGKKVTSNISVRLSNAEPKQLPTKSNKHSSEKNVSFSKENFEQRKSTEENVQDDDINQITGHNTVVGLKKEKNSSTIKKSYSKKHLLNIEDDKTIAKISMRDKTAHDQKLVKENLDNANVTTMAKEKKKTGHINMLNKAEIEVATKECHIDEKPVMSQTQNLENVVQNESLSNEALENISKTAITIPKKRKYLLNFSTVDVNEKSDKTKNAKNAQENINVSTNIEKNCSLGKESTVHETRKRTSSLEANSPEAIAKIPNSFAEVLHDLESSKTDNSITKNEENSEISENYSKKKNSPNEDVKLPKKRGRPRKIPDTRNDYYTTSSPVNTITDKAHDKYITVEDVDMDQVETSIILPKKRGRKKKSVQPVQTVPSEVEEDIELDESRSGRKRKKINYLELANEWEGNIDDEQKRKHKFSIQNNLEKANPDKRQRIDDEMDKNITSADSIHGISVESGQGDLDLSETNTSNHPEINNADASINDEDNSTEDADKSNKRKNKSKYRRTGETTMMMNSVFAAAFKNKSICENEDDLNISGEASLSSVMSVNQASNRSRKRKSLANIVVDQDNMTICVTCNKKVKNDNWEEHNRQEHNNLAWREGELEIALDNSSVVAKILKPILKEDKEIKCNKCKNSFKTVGSFTGHMEKCSGVLSSNGLVTCAICKMEMEKTKWPNHKQRQHNNLAWRIGDHPLNLNDQNLVISILSAVCKTKKRLYCEKCTTSKKSVVGFLSHQSQCGVQLEEVKIKCQFCEKKVLPVSMQTHIKMVHETPKEKDVVYDASYFNVDAETSSTKRKAAKTAMLVINKFSSEKMVQEHSKHYAAQMNFSEEDFVKVHLKKELSNNNIVKCKFNDCSFVSDTVISVMEHMNSCELKPDQYFVCRRCLSIATTEDEMKGHVKNIHNIDIAEDEYEANDCEDLEEEMKEQCDLEMKRGSLHEKSKMERDPHYKPKPTFILNLSKRACQLFSQAYNYTMSFCKQHYSTNGLFKGLHCLKSEWLLLNDGLIEEYLRQHAQSCDIAKRRVKNYENVLGDEYVFKKFDLFESECDNGTATIFCGGPIQTMAWLPTPYTSSDCRQVLAVAPLNDFDRKYLINLHYSDKSVIQFWDFGILKNKQPMIGPKLMFCLAYDFGPVWHLEWCPSGCYDVEPIDDSEKMSRMGILAAAGSDSVVYIYSIPHFSDGETGLIYKVKPVLKLHLDFGDEHSLSGQKLYATKISWSKASSHRYMAVGYTDGVVALFDLDARSNLLRCKDKGGCEVLLPFRSFQPHTHMITVVDLIHLADGKRWLLTGSFDRNIIVWDLTNDFKMSSKRNIISDGLWLTNWIAFLCTADESSTKQSAVPTLLTSYRDYLYDHVNLTTSSSSVKTISASSWLNGIIYCSAVGEITAMFPAQLLFGLDNDKKLKRSIYLFGCTKLINKHLFPEERLAEAKRKSSLSAETSKKKTTDNEDHVSTVNDNCEPISYQAANKKYGLLFCDSKMDNYSDFGKEGKKPKSNEEQEVSKANLYPMQAINKAAYNPNLQASLYYAVGYQAGFVRVTYMKFLEKDLQIKLEGFSSNYR